jgi:DNA replication protein DnaC
MTKIISPYIIKIDEFGNEYTVDNPDYKKKVAKDKYNLILEKSNIPSFYWNINFKDYKGDKDSKEIKKIIKYAENCFKESYNYIHLYLWGNQSTQKTALACNILKTCIKNGMKAKFILAGVLIDYLMKLQGFAKDEDIYYKIKELKECDVLLIDDIGDINKSVYWTKSESKNMILACWDTFIREIVVNRAKARVIMTSNYDIGIFKQYFGESLFELIDRNFAQIQLTQSVKSIRKFNVNKIFEEIE